MRMADVCVFVYVRMADICALVCFLVCMRLVAVYVLVCVPLAGQRRVCPIASGVSARLRRGCVPE